MLCLVATAKDLVCGRPVRIYPWTYRRPNDFPIEKLVVGPGEFLQCSMPVPDPVSKPRFW